MPNPIIPFRQMRPTLRTIQAQVQLVLAIPTIEWPENDYALFLAMGEMGRAMDNPTRLQMLTQIGVWLRFYQRLIGMLPEGELRTNLTAEFQTISAPYQKLLEAQPT